MVSRSTSVITVTPTPHPPSTPTLLPASAHSRPVWFAGTAAINGTTGLVTAVVEEGKKARRSRVSAG